MLAFGWKERRKLKYYGHRFISELSIPQKRLTKPINLRSGTIYFNDKNHWHLKSAYKNGIQPLQKDYMVKRMAKKKRLVNIKNNKLYRLKRLYYSQPYLTLQANELLKDLAELFQSKLAEKGIPKHYFLVSSVLRTEESVKKLRKKNRNASKNSAHMYATTFDITYKEFIDADGNKTYEPSVRKVLSESIRELRNKERCYVKTEVTQLCFHITVR